MASRLHDFPRWSLVPLALATIGIGGLGARLVGAEFESAEREARAELEARAAQGARAISDVVAETRSPDQTAEGGFHARIENGRFVHPLEPRAATSFGFVPGRDVEGEFLLAASEQREIAGDDEGAIGALTAAAAEARDPPIRVIANFRVAALRRARGETDAADRAAQDALAGMDETTRETSREALLLAVLAHTAAGAPITATTTDSIAALIGGPDDALGRSLLASIDDRDSQRLAIRELELERMERIRRARFDPTVGRPQATLAGRSILVATRRDASTLDVDERLLSPPLDALRLVDVREAVDESAPDPTATLSARAPVGALLPGIFVEESRPLREVAAAGRRRAWLVGSLIGLTLVAFGAALAAIAAAARREREAAAAKGEFVTRVGHDLRTPLSLIRMYGETLAAGRVDDAAQARDFASVIARESERLTRLVSTVLDFARVQDAAIVRARTRFDLASLVAEVANAHRPLAERAGMAITIEGCDEPLPVDADEDALRGALGNLIENALQHAASGKAIDVHCRRDHDAAEIEVADRGPGVPESDLERIFERFVRGSNAPDSRTKGAGLGLALVHEIANLHGGSATARNREGGGFVCRLRIPGARVELPNTDRNGRTGQNGRIGENGRSGQGRSPA